MRFSFLLVATGLLPLIHAFPGYITGRCENIDGAKDYYAWDSREEFIWTGETRPDVIAHRQNKYNGHTYFFDVSLSSKKRIEIMVDAPHGKVNDQFFKISIRNSNRDHLHSFTARKGTHCFADIDKGPNDIADIVVQQQIRTF